MIFPKVISVLILLGRAGLAVYPLGVVCFGVGSGDFVQVMRFIISGVMPNEEGEEEPSELDQRKNSRWRLEHHSAIGS